MWLKLFFLWYPYQQDATMVKLAAASILVFQAIAIVVAFKKPSDINEYNIVKNHRTRMRQNYIVQKTKNEDTDNMDDFSMMYPVEPLEEETKPEELPALIVDYANMIRNDIILMDNSVQTRTRKRGNVKTEKHNQRVQEVPCICEAGKKLIILGDNYIPRSLEKRQCDDSACPAPYSCRSRTHNVTVLRRKKDLDEVSKEELPADLKRWVTINIPVTIGCLCSKGYIEV